MNSDNLLILLIAVAFFTFGVVTGLVGERSGIEKKCIYQGRVEFSGQLFSCQWLPGVTTTDKQYDRKPHPLKEGLMKWDF